MTRPFSLLAASWVAAALGASPGHDDWQEGVRLHSSGEYKDAQAQFERAAGRDPANSKYQLWLGYAIGRRVEAMPAFRRIGAMPLVRKVKQQFVLACELDESSLEALEALLGFHLDAPSIAGGNKAEAHEIARRIEKLDNARGARALALYFERMGEQANAREQLERARDLDPGDLGHTAALASYLARRGEHARSDELFAVCFDEDPDDHRLWVVAAAAWAGAKRRELYPKARQLLERYLAAPLPEPTAEPKFLVRRLLGRL